MGPCLRCDENEEKKTMFQALTLADNAMKTVSMSPKKRDNIITNNLERLYPVY
jgi:hypothetical protein